MRMKDANLFSVDRIDLLQTLVRIVEAGSLSAAARLLGTTQPTVSRRLQSLEQLLGCRLLHRSTHQLKLTEQGEHCYRQARVLLSQWQALSDGVREQQQGPTGLLRVRAPHAFGRDQLLQPLLQYLRDWPALSVDWQLNDRPPDFLSEALDCAIHVGAVDNPNVVALPLAQVPRIVVAAPQLLASAVAEAGLAAGRLADHAAAPLTVQQAVQDGLIQPGAAIAGNTANPAGAAHSMNDAGPICATGPVCAAHWQDPAALAALPWLAFATYYRHEIVLQSPGEPEVHLTLQPRFFSDNLYAIREAALAGLGVAIVSEWVVRADLAAGRLVRVAPAWQAAPLPIYLLYPYAPYYPARLRHFIDFMRQVLPQITELPASTG